MADKEGALRNEIIETGKILYDKRLVAGRSGNLSARLDNDHILITTTGTALGRLKEDEIIKVNLLKDADNKRLSTEFPVHSLIYKHSAANTVIHCHPPLINGYFCVCSELKALTFETKLYLGQVPVVSQDTPSITKPEAVVEALKTNNLVVIKNHGVVSVADKFEDGLYQIEALEEAVRVAAVARLFNKEILDSLDKELKQDLSGKGASYRMFSKEHIQAIVDLVNSDEFISQKGNELDLTLQLAVVLNEDSLAYKFNFEKGRITSLGFDAEAPFVISADRAAWEPVFLGKLDPFVAVMQGKMKLKGELGKLSRWYVPFSRLFELFKQVSIHE